MATCPNGHENPPSDHFCGECGAPLVASSAAELLALAAEAEAEAAKAEAQSAMAHARAEASHAAPDRRAMVGTPLAEGVSVKVVAPGDDHDGQIGTIYELLDDDSGVCVQFSGDSEPYAFGRGELEAVHTPRHKPTVHKVSGSQPKRSGPKPRQQPPTQAPHPARVLSDPQRAAILDQNLVAAASQGGHVETRTEAQAVVVTGKPVNHVLHLLLSVFLCSLWVPVWLIVALTGGERRSTVTVDQYGAVSWEKAPMDLAGSS